VSTLRVAVDYNVSARALGIEVGDLRDTVASTLSNLVAVVCTLGYVELDVDVVASLALSSELRAGRVEEGCGTAVMVRGIVAASHEDDYIGTCCVELSWGSLRGGKSSESANGDGVTDEGHDYVLGLYNYKRVWVDTVRRDDILRTIVRSVEQMWAAGEPAFNSRFIRAIDRPFSTIRIENEHAGMVARFPASVGSKIFTVLYLGPMGVGHGGYSNNVDVGYMRPHARVANGERSSISLSLHPRPRVPRHQTHELDAGRCPFLLSSTWVPNAESPVSCQHYDYNEPFDLFPHGFKSISSDFLTVHPCGIS
jgi:hypothetical protein